MQTKTVHFSGQFSNIYFANPHIYDNIILVREMKKDSTLFKLLKCPYRKNDNENMSSIYERYKKDTHNIIQLDEQTFYKIIECYEFHTKSSNLLVVLDNQMQLRIGDTLIDENDNIYGVKAFEMFRFIGNDFPERYLKISFVAIDGDIEKIGDHLAKVDSKTEHKSPIKSCIDDNTHLKNIDDFKQLPMETLDNLIAREEAKTKKLSDEELDIFVEECKEKYGHLFTTCFWRSNPDWYDYDENDEPYLTVLAPPEAQASFKMSMDKLKKSIETGIIYD